MAIGDITRNQSLYICKYRDNEISKLVSNRRQTSVSTAPSQRHRKMLTTHGNRNARIIRSSLAEIYARYTERTRHSYESRYILQERVSERTTRCSRSDQRRALSAETLKLYKIEILVQVFDIRFVRHFSRASNFSCPRNGRW